MDKMMEYNCGPMALNWSSCICSARQCKNLHVGGPQTSGGGIIIKGIINIKIFYKINYDFNTTNKLAKENVLNYE